MNSRKILLFPLFIILISIQAGCFYLTHAPTAVGPNSKEQGSQAERLINHGVVTTDCNPSHNRQFSRVATSHHLTLR